MRIDDGAEAEYVASCNECTGLLPALTDDGGDEDCRALYAVKRAKRPRRRGKSPA